MPEILSRISVRDMIPPLLLLAAVLAAIIAMSRHMMNKLGADFLKWVEDGEETDFNKISAIEKRLCPDCRAKLRENRPVQKCPKCGHELMGSDREYFSYLNHIHKRYIFQTIPVCVALSFFPLMGFVIGYFYIKGAVIRPFANYLPFGRRLKTKWTMKFVVLAISLFQLLPAYGAISVPLVAFIKYWFFMSAFRELARPGKDG